MSSLKILVGCPTSNYQAYCLQEYAEAVKKLSYPNYNILLLDNSKDNIYSEKIHKYDLPLRKGMWFESARKRIVTSRNILRKIALTKDYDYFLSLEQDVIPPKDIIERLLSHKKDIVSGIYYTIKDKALRPLIVVKHPDGLSYLDSEKILDYKALIEITFCGLGCLLISRKALSSISFRYVEGNKSFDDFWFCKDAAQQGFKLYADTSLLCHHLFLKRPWKWSDLKK